jgi:hypothetical protein
MNLNPSIVSFGGVGKPRIMVDDDLIYTATGTVAFTATTVSETGSPSLSQIRVNMRVRGIVTGTPDKVSFGKVAAVDDTNDIITVDAWTNGTPSAANKFTVEGWIIDLPYCNELTERFEPDYLTHELYRGDKGAKIDTLFRGWKYVCTLDYSRYISADTILSMRKALGPAKDKAITLIPHADQPGFNYEVLYDAAVDVSRYGISPGYRKPVFVFRCVENIPSWPLIDGYGMEYGTDYGNHL